MGVKRTTGPAEGDDETPGGSDIMSREGRALSAVLGMPVAMVNYGEVMFRARERIAALEADLLSSRASEARLAEGLRELADLQAARFGWASIEYWRKAMEREHGSGPNASEYQRSNLRLATEVCALLSAPSATTWLEAREREAVRSALSDSLDAVVAEFLPWAMETFPTSTPASCVEHLRREVQELIADPTDPTELADCAFFVVDTAHRAGVDLAEAMREKLAILKTRKWGKPDAHGVTEHVRDAILSAPASEEG